RLAALDALNNLGAADLQKLSLQVLPGEKHPEVAKRLREVEFSNRRPDRDSQDYEDKFHDAKIELINSSARSLTGAESYLKADSSLKFLDGATLRNQAYLDLKDLYFNGVGGFFRFAWEGESGVDADHAKLLDKYAGYMKNSMDALGTKAATEPEALKALVYVALSNGRPLLKDDRAWGAEKATEKLKDICQNASPEKAKEIAWAVQNLLLHQPTMSAQGRQNVLDGLKSLIAKPGQAGLSDTQVSTLLAAAMQRELRNTPAAGAKDFAAREKLQLDMLNLLSNPKYRNKDILPVLEAIADGTPKFKVVKDNNGVVSKVQYPDGSSRELQKVNGVDARYVFTDAQGKQSVWLPDAAKPNTWYKDSDKEKKEPWVGTNRFDSVTGDYITFNEKDGVTRVLQPSGAQLDLLDNKVARIQYPNGTSKEFDPPGDKFARFTLKGADGKVTESYVRDGNSDTFYSVDDKEKKKPWTGKEMLDPSSGDHVVVQGQTRTVKSSNGAVYETKDGVTKELSPPSSVAFNTSINSVRLKAQELYAQLADRSDTIRQQAQLPEGSTPDQIAKRISDDLARASSSSERIGKSIALSEKLGAIKDDKDPRRDVLSVAARDGHELVRLMAARELVKSSNASDRSLAYSVLASLEKQGSRPGYVSEAHELIGQIIADKQVSAEDKAQLDSYRKDAIKLDAASYRAQDRSADMQSNLDYQDAFERATQELKENALRVRSLSKYEGSDNWFSKNDNYKLLDADKLREGVKQAVTDAYPGMIPWLFTSQATIDKKCNDAVNDTYRKQTAQLASLGEQAKLTDGKAEREALASIILSQGQPFSEGDRRWAMQKASIAIYNCIKDGHPGSRDMLWAVKAALIEEPSLDPISRSYLIGAVEQAKTRGIMDSKEASIVMAAALQSEYQGMPSKDKDPKGYKDSIDNQLTAITLISNWGNREASPALEALANYHPDALVRATAKGVFNDLNRTSLQLRRDAAARARDGGDRRQARSDAEMQAELNKLQAHILEFERIRLRLPVGATPEQIEKAQKAESGKK
ncbi:MAG: hypothetical protein K2X81_22415, partial [Candidatus Obscuribacterales bacterium]|nr:hypothetical protein [Candidatus Obscuribacterales bacterium]